MREQASQKTGSPLRTALHGADLFIADNVPLGAQGELEPALRWMRKESGVACVLGLRNVLDDGRSVRGRWMRDRNVEAVNAFYDHVWASVRRPR